MGHVLWGKLLLFQPWSGLSRLHFPGKYSPGVGSGWSIPLPRLQEDRVASCLQWSYIHKLCYCCLGSKLRPTLLRPPEL